MIKNKKIISSLATLGVVLGTSVAANAQTNIDVMLSLVVDGSGSIGSTNYANQLQAYAAVFNDPTFYDDVIAKGNEGKIAVNFIQFSSSAQEEVSFSLIENQTDSSAFGADIIAAIPSYLGGGTSIASGINLCSSTISDDLGSTYNASSILCDVSTDGQANAQLTRDARDAALLADVQRINAIGIGSGVSEDFLVDNVQGGPDSFTLVTPDFMTFETAIREKIVTEIIGPQPTPEPTSLLGLLAIGGLTLAPKRKKQS